MWWLSWPGSGLGVKSIQNYYWYDLGIIIITKVCGRQELFHCVFGHHTSPGMAWPGPGVDDDDLVRVVQSAVEQWRGHDLNGGK